MLFNSTVPIITSLILNILGKFLECREPFEGKLLSLVLRSEKEMKHTCQHPHPASVNSIHCINNTQICFSNTFFLSL